MPQSLVDLEQQRNAEMLEPSNQGFRCLTF